ncbi:MAG: hypothetical protein KF830_13405 [Planctomycetes bacterium]|nr:hypothetical protein [Planctomycetota bacterium]
MSSKTGPDAAATARPARGRTLVLRLTALYTTIASLVLLVAVLIVYRELVLDLDREDDVLLRENALLVDALLLQPQRDPRQALLALDDNRKRLGARRILIRIVDDGGAVLIETPGMPPGLSMQRFPAPAEPDVADLRGLDLRSEGRRFRLLAVNLKSTAIGGDEAVVQLALDRAADDVLQDRYRNILLGVTVPGLLLSAVFGQWMARRAIAPIAAVAERIRGIDAASLHARVADADLVEELRPLVESFNELLGRLEDAFDRLRNFGAHLAHELRTPINNLCGEIENALLAPDSDLAEVLRSARDEAQTLSHIIEGLLFLAHAERPGTRAAMVPRDLVGIVHGLIEFYEPLATDAGIELVAVDEATPSVPIDRPMVQRALSNLLDNSLAFTPRGGRITVTTRIVDGQAEIEVADTGCGIAEDRLPHVFDGAYSTPQVRATNAPRTGLGIGLSIVRSIMRLHGGGVRIDSRPGQGCRVRLRFA